MAFPGPLRRVRFRRLRGAVLGERDGAAESTQSDFARTLARSSLTSDHSVTVAIRFFPFSSLVGLICFRAPGGRSPPLLSAVVPEGWFRHVGTLAARWSRHATDGARMDRQAACAADLGGDQPGNLSGVPGADPEIGSGSLGAGPEAPTEALDRSWPSGNSGSACCRARIELRIAPVAAAGGGRRSRSCFPVICPVPTLVDCGTAAEPASRAVVEVADVAVVVLRGCYLALRRVVQGAEWRMTNP